MDLWSLMQVTMEAHRKDFSLEKYLEFTVDRIALFRGGRVMSKTYLGNLSCLDVSLKRELRAKAMRPPTIQMSGLH